jgi:hypothetical protein
MAAAVARYASRYAPQLQQAYGQYQGLQQPQAYGEYQGLQQPPPMNYQEYVPEGTSAGAVAAGVGIGTILWALFNALVPIPMVAPLFIFQYCLFALIFFPVGIWTTVGWGYAALIAWLTQGCLFAVIYFFVTRKLTQLAVGI